MNIADIRKNKVFSAPIEYATRNTEEPLPVNRSAFQRDRDRILYSKSFRRLNGKTQVFLTRSHDHVRNRLTHSLEVNQIACTTAKNLGLDHELTEAISLGHDIGHTPFGHVGERTLNMIMNNCISVTPRGVALAENERGFKHNLQGVRILSDLHQIYPLLKGTNLTNFTLYGIAKHSNLTYSQCKSLHSGICYRKDRDPCPINGWHKVDFYSRYDRNMKIKGESIFAWSFEADVVEFADEISQRHHDVEDAYLMQILNAEDIVEKIKDCFSSYLTRQATRKLDDISKANDFFAPLISQFLVNLYNTDLISTSRENFKKYAIMTGINRRSDFTNYYKALSPEDAKGVIAFSKDFDQCDKCFKKILWGTILNSHRAQRMDGKGSYLIEKLFKAYYTNPRQLHDSTVLAVFNLLEGTSHTLGAISKPTLGEYRNKIASPTLRADRNFETNLMRAICDHIAGMTDNFVIEEYTRLYGDGAI